MTPRVDVGPELPAWAMERSALARAGSTGWPGEWTAPSSPRSGKSRPSSGPRAPSQLFPLERAAGGLNTADEVLKDTDPHGRKPMFYNKVMRACSGGQVHQADQARTRHHHRAGGQPDGVRGGFRSDGP